ncbi:MAG: hypothetical protein KC800_20510, partial [Candidatus Eremiobacteraeota bacterium]|nr:hypothetical protein [Candidatus Eremiobacteraeota bacterium]
GDTVFVFGGSTINGPLTIPNGISLIGQGAGLVVAQTVVEPGTAPTLVGPVTPTQNNVLAGFRTAGSTGPGIDMGIGTNVAGLTIRSNRFENNAEEHIYMTDTGSPISIESNVFTGSAAGFDAIFHEKTGGNKVIDLSIDNNTFTSDGTASQGRAIAIQSLGSETHQFGFRGNTITGTNNTLSYTDGLYFTAQGASVNNIEVSGNTISGMENSAVFFENASLTFPGGGGGTINADIFNNSFTGSGVTNLLLDFVGGPGYPKTIKLFSNTLTGSDDDGIQISLIANATLRLVASDNTISGSADDGIFIDRQQTADGTFIIQNNQFTNNGGDGIEGMIQNGGMTGLFEVGLFDNIFTNSNEDDVEFSAINGAAEACFDIERNTFSSNVSLNPQSSNTFIVEQFNAGLNTINTFLSGSVTTSGNAIVNAANGDCDIN